MPLNSPQNITGKKLIFSASLLNDITFVDANMNELNTVNMDVNYIDNNYIVDSNAGYYAFIRHGQIETVIKNGIFSNGDAANDHTLYFGIGTTVIYKRDNGTVITKGAAALEFDIDELLGFDTGARLLIQGDTNLTIKQKTGNQYTELEIYVISD